MTNPKSRQERIIEIFAEQGGYLSPRRLAWAVVEAGVYSDTELRDAGVKWVQAQCIRALKRQDSNGLPFAGPVVHDPDDDDNAPWQPRLDWGYETYVANCEIRANDAASELHIAARMADECLFRYPNEPRPPVPELVMP